MYEESEDSRHLVSPSIHQQHLLLEAHPEVESLCRFQSRSPTLFSGFRSVTVNQLCSRTNSVSLLGVPTKLNVFRFPHLNAIYDAAPNFISMVMDCHLSLRRQISFARKTP
jgi:hypothetical protein